MTRRIIVIALVIICTSCLVNAQDSIKAETPEELGRLIFKALKNNDFVLFESLLITEEKLEGMLTLIEATDSVKAEYRVQAKGLICHIHNQASANFDSLLAKTSKHDIDWEKAEIIDIKTGTKHKKGIDYAAIVIMMKSEEKMFLIGLDKCGKSDFWYIMDEVEIEI